MLYSVLSLSRLMTPSLYQCPFRLSIGVVSSFSQTSGSSLNSDAHLSSSSVKIGSDVFTRDSWTSVTPRIIEKMNAKLLSRKYHPLFLLKERIQDYFYTNHHRKHGNPLFTVFEDISPVVSPYQNFDSLLVPEDHVSRSPKDAYYINENWMLRSHTTAHDSSLINMGADAFLIFGDVYRRDAIDSTHYPVFHQADGVRLFSAKELFSRAHDPHNALRLFETGSCRTVDKQEGHTLETVKMIEFELKSTLEGLASALFGKDVEFRWVDAYFPFTHPSWEMEVLLDDEWVEMLGCGILEQKIINEAGALGKVGWAFGIGMERWAMRLYSIPDIRIFWSDDSGVTKQFEVDDIHQPIFFKPVSAYPPCITDISFWLPSVVDKYSENDFYDLVRNIGGDKVEQVRLIDQYIHPKTQRQSHCYRIVYRDMSRTLTQAEVNQIHSNIAETAKTLLGVEIR